VADDLLDIAFVNGAVFRSDPARSWARAVGIRGSTIAAVGSDDRILALVGSNTRVVDLGGRLLTAGFQDAHVHPASGGMILIRCNLMGCGDAREVADEIRRHAASLPDGAWVLGGGWRYDWYPGGCPTAAELDVLTGGRPAYLTVADGHSGWANSAAFSSAGIDSTTPDPIDGRIERQADGATPQGTLHEGAMDLVAGVIPDPAPADREKALLAGQDYLFSMGVTSWQDAAVTPELHATYLALARNGRLRANVRGSLWWERGEDLEQIDRHVLHRSQAHGRYVPGTVKLMLDGVCENFTASVLEPYLDARSHQPTDNRGIDMIDLDRLPEIVTRLDRLGFQCHFHAIGDRAVRNALDAVEAARLANGWSEGRHHIAHIQIVHPADIPRFRRLGVAANAQPLWACNEPQMTELTIPILGGERVDHQYPFRALIHQGATMAMGSDWSVSTADVMKQIAVAVDRLPPYEGTFERFLAHQRIGLTDGLMAFTAGSAWVNHLEGSRGQITPGHSADLVVMDRNPFESTERIWDTQVDLTLVDGSVAYQRSPAGAPW
jgi:predicted amidohydrolase YtcJ